MVDLFQTVDYEYLNTQCKRETHYTGTPLHLACPVQEDCFGCGGRLSIRAIQQGIPVIDNIHHGVGTLYVPQNASRLSGIGGCIHKEVWRHHSWCAKSCEDRGWRIALWWDDWGGFLPYVPLLDFGCANSSSVRRMWILEGFILLQTVLLHLLQCWWPFKIFPRQPTSLMLDHGLVWSTEWRGHIL